MTPDFNFAVFLESAPSESIFALRLPFAPPIGCVIRDMALGTPHDYRVKDITFEVRSYTQGDIAKSKVNPPLPEVIGGCMFVEPTVG